MRRFAFLTALLALAAPVSAQDEAGANAAWVACVMDKARAFARSSAEPANIVADAALGACVREENAVRREIERTADGDLYVYQALLDDALASLRRQAIAEAITARAG